MKVCVQHHAFINDHSVNICALVLKMLFNLEGQSEKEFLSRQGSKEVWNFALLYDEFSLPLFWWGGGSSVLLKAIQSTEAVAENVWLIEIKKKHPRAPQRLNACLR